MLGYCEECSYIPNKGSHLDFHLVQLLGRHTVHPRLHCNEDDSASNPWVSGIIDISAKSKGGLRVVKASTSFCSCANLNIIEIAILRRTRLRSKVFSLERLWT